MVAPGWLTLWVESADHKPAATPVIEISGHPGPRWVKKRARELRAEAILRSGQNACHMDEMNGAAAGPRDCREG